MKDIGRLDGGQVELNAVLHQIQSRSDHGLVCILEPDLILRILFKASQIIGSRASGRRSSERQNIAFALFNVIVFPGGPVRFTPGPVFQDIVVAVNEIAQNLLFFRYVFHDVPVDRHALLSVVTENHRAHNRGSQRIPVRRRRIVVLRLFAVGLGADIRNPPRHIRRDSLLPCTVAIDIVRLVERDCAAHGLQVVTLAAGGAGVDGGIGELFQNRVPHAEMPLNIQVFRNARTVAVAVLRRVRILPGGQRVAVEVLTVHGYAALGHNLQYAFKRPFHGFFPAHVDKVAVQHPVGVHGQAVRAKGGCVRHPLRLKPQ